MLFQYVFLKQMRQYRNPLCRYDLPLDIGGFLLFYNYHRMQPDEFLPPGYHVRIVMLLILNIIEQVTYNYIYYYIMIYTAQVISRSETLNERACTARTVTIYILYDTCIHAISCSGRCYCQTIIQSHDISLFF